MGDQKPPEANLFAPFSWGIEEKKDGIMEATKSVVVNGDFTLYGGTKPDFEKMFKR